MVRSNQLATMYRMQCSGKPVVSSGFLRAAMIQHEVLLRDSLREMMLFKRAGSRSAPLQERTLVCEKRFGFHPRANQRLRSQAFVVPQALRMKY